MPKMIKVSTVDEYISLFPNDIQERLSVLRKLVKEIAPKAVESISYGMPAYKLNGKPLVYFAAQKSHFGFYATPSTHEALKKELARYKQGKGSVQFPFNEELPLDTIKKMVSFKVEELSN